MPSQAPPCVRDKACKYFQTQSGASRGNIFKMSWALISSYSKWSSSVLDIAILSVTLSEASDFCGVCVVSVDDSPTKLAFMARGFPPRSSRSNRISGPIAGLLGYPMHFGGCSPTIALAFKKTSPSTESQTINPKPFSGLNDRILPTVLDKSPGSELTTAGLVIAETCSASIGGGGRVTVLPFPAVPLAPQALQPPQGSASFARNAIAGLGFDCCSKFGRCLGGVEIANTSTVLSSLRFLASRSSPSKADHDEVSVCCVAA
mmetsp:Transcript_10135/g.16445  ORF Transcript_10135/g.16445 Transcript_10135/m.16445 type:complete len:261 (-) Transcript_10135:1073-1855(-)